MKKVLVIVPYSYLPFYSGGQKFIAQFLEYLAKEVDLTVITVPQNDFSLAKNYKTLPLLKKSFYRYIDVSLVSKLVALIKNDSFDTIIWEHPYYAWAAFLVKKQTGIKTIIHSHNIEFQRFKDLRKWWWLVLKKYEQQFFSFADYIFFITPTDKEFAIQHWNVPIEKCINVPFGITVREYPKDKAQCKKLLQSWYRIEESDTIILFNGVLDYKPNLDALIAILEKINPGLLVHSQFKYKIIICGKRLPAEFNELKAYREKNIIYAGFVEDIDTYFKGADLFLNPVQTGGGIKTKMVEAIGFGTTVIATGSGAKGINKKVAKEKLTIVEDNRWELFANAIKESRDYYLETPPEYYAYYSWRGIIEKLKHI
jgi:glycosyltransferase involved in cell wall biosynthesis